MSKIIHLGGFLGSLLRLLLKTGLPVIGNVLKPLARSVLVPLGLMALASATDAAIQKKIFGSATTTLAFSNEDLNDIRKIVKCLKGSGLLIKGVSETVKKELKEQKGWVLGMLAATLGASLLGKMLAGKLVKTADEGTIRAGEGQDFWCRLINYLILKYKNIIKMNIDLMGFLQ